MTEKFLICIECPIGCEITVGLEGDAVEYIRGNSCPRGRIYAEDEIVCPKRILTTTIRAKNGKMIPVKTDKPMPKNEIFLVMEKIKEALAQFEHKDYAGVANHEQAFYPEFYAHQPDMSEKITTMARTLHGFGFKFITCEDFK